MSGNGSTGNACGSATPRSPQNSAAVWAGSTSIAASGVNVRDPLPPRAHAHAPHPRSGRRGSQSPPPTCRPTACSPYPSHRRRPARHESRSRDLERQQLRCPDRRERVSALPGRDVAVAPGPGVRGGRRSTSETPTRHSRRSAAAIRCSPARTTTVAPPADRARSKPRYRHRRDHRARPPRRDTLYRRRPPHGRCPARSARRSTPAFRRSATPTHAANHRRGVLQQDRPFSVQRHRLASSPTNQSAASNDSSPPPPPQPSRCRRCR